MLETLSVPLVTPIQSPGLDPVGDKEIRLNSLAVECEVSKTCSSSSSVLMFSYYEVNRRLLHICWCTPRWSVAVLTT